MWQAGRQTASITFTSGVRPVCHFVRANGSRAVAEIDLTNHLFTLVDDTKFPGPVARIRSAVVPGLRLIRQGVSVFRNRASGRDRFFAWMGRRSEELYDGICTKSETPPVPYAEVNRISEDIDRTHSVLEKPSAQGRWRRT